jgi:polar amino acid transport system substrate-binding protein
MNRSKKVFCLLLVVYICLLFSTLATAAELKFNTQDLPPYNYETNGVVSGPAVDIIKEVCSEMKVTCTYQLLPWNRAQENVKEKGEHGLFVLAKNKEREEWLHFSPPIMNVEWGFFVKDDNPLVFKQQSDVIGYTVGVFGPSATSKNLEEFRDKIKDIKIDMTIDDESAFRKLSLGKINAVYSNRDVGHAMMKKLDLKNIRYAGVEKKSKYYIAFSKKNTDKAIVDQFNEKLLSLEKKGVIRNIVKKYSLEPAN